MTLFEEIIKECGLLMEITTNRDDDIKKAIDNVLRVRIKYDDGKDKVISRAKGKNERYILPVAYGITKNGKRAIRAYQTAGSTKRGAPKWKLFLLDNIYSWANGTKSFKNYRDELIRLGLNTSGDKGMTTIFAITPFADSDVEIADDSRDIKDTPETKNDVGQSQTVRKTTTTAKDSATTEPQRSEKNTVDNGRENSYFNKKVEAPANEPVMKDEIAPENGEDNTEISIPSDMVDNNAEASRPADDEPITKDEVEQGETNNNDDNIGDNPLTSSFNDMMNRMNGLYQDSNEKEEKED